jgi:16S rRNA (guanine966-N2)-methyltransferase
MEALGDRIEGARILDLFSGSGALGIEALSRGAASVDFVEDGGPALHALKANVLARKIRPLRRGEVASKRNKAVRIFKRDAIPFVARLTEGTYDLAFADPPYGSRKLDRILERWFEVPFSGVLCIEHALDHAVPAGGKTQRFEHSALTFYGL